MEHLKFIAEIGSNWIGVDGITPDKMLYNSISQAWRAGANAVKLQYFRANTLYSRHRAPDLHARSRAFELPTELLAYAAEVTAMLGIELWVSVFDPNLVKEVSRYADALKIASGDLTYLGLRHEVSKFAERTIGISTGAALDYEIREAIGGLGYNNVVLFYCVSEYPASPHDFRLGSLLKYKGMVESLGLSDHTRGSLVATLAVAKGYTVFEKHFKAFGANESSPDFDVSSDPNEFEKYVTDIMVADRICGGDKKTITASEARERLWARRGSDGLRPTEEALA